ncbi:hypothetical protein E2C01_066849 [Portunus trituberculatus]|uniref:Uncharacterized protein n=1 Tax=Portunus trituberculatus TaxID=210409 RepID=A0A5B7HUZ2_PORTR|nr:hypothetical protein [Portunus trituberculatus]
MIFPEEYQGFHGTLLAEMQRPTSSPDLRLRSIKLGASFPASLSPHSSRLALPASLFPASSSPNHGHCGQRGSTLGKAAPSPLMRRVGRRKSENSGAFCGIDVAGAGETNACIQYRLALSPRQFSKAKEKTSRLQKLKWRIKIVKTVAINLLTFIDP